MARKKLVVAALLLTVLAGMAVAADIAEHQSQNAQKIIAALNAAGINKEFQEIVKDTDTRIDHGYYTLAEENVPGGKVVVRYHLSLNNPTKQLELMYAPEESHVQCTLGSDHITVSYHLNF